MNHHRRERHTLPSTHSTAGTAAAALRLVRRLALLAALTIVPLVATPAWADFDHEFDCLPNQPGCLPNGELYLGFNKPDKELTWFLTKRGHRWSAAWRSHLNSTKPWMSETYDPHYVHPSSFEAQFVNQCQSQADWDYFVNSLSAAEGQTNTYRWSVNGVVHVAAGDCYLQKLYFPGEGIYEVKLEVIAPGSSTPFLTKTTTARVRDYLIVLLGDSAASGEGSPDYQRPEYGVVGTWVDRRCHRSKEAAVPRAVEELENDPHSTVTFLNFACSGATLNLDEPGQGGGILSPYAGIEPTLGALEYGHYDPSFYLPSQVDQLSWALHWKPNNQYDINPRKIDMLFVTGGINDVRFSKLALACVLLNDCHNQFTSIYGGSNAVKQTFETLASNIPSGYVALKNALDEAGIQVEPGRTYVMQYPDAFQDQNGNRCKTMLEDVLPASSVWNLVSTPVGLGFLGSTILGPFIEHETGLNPQTILASALTGNLRWSSDEIDWMVDHAMPALDNAVRKGAKDAGFEFIDGVQKAFAKHGYCSSKNWIRRAVESSDVQGPMNFISEPLPFGLGVQALTKGLMHPAPDGYAAWAKVIWPTVKQLWNQAPVAKPDSYVLDTAVNTVFNTPIFSGGVLFNDVDPDGDPVWAILTKPPKYGTAKLSIHGDLEYTPDPGVHKVDTLYYVVTDGGLTSKEVKVTIKVYNGMLKDVPWQTIEFGQTIEIGGLVARTEMSGPYEVRFDGEIPIDWGFLRPIPGRDAVLFVAPDKPRKRRLTLPYTVHSLTEDRTSPDYGRSIRGVLKIRIVRKLR